MVVRRVAAALLAAMLALLWFAPTAVAAEQADLEITQTGSPNPAPVGGQLTWTILVRNNGPGTGVSVEVNGNFNQYGPTTEFVSLATTSGTCTHTTNTYNCQIGTVAANATVTISLVVTVLSGDSVVSVADVTTGSSDPDWSNNHSVGEVEAGPAADVRLAKTVSPTTAAPGDTVAYTLTVTNAGPTTASGIELSDALPEGLVDATVAPAADCEVNDADLSCSLASLGSGQTFTATVEATVDPAFTGTELVNDASVTSTTIDSDPSNNTASAVVQVESASADLSVTKSLDPDDPIAGEPIEYTLSVRNAGPSAAEDSTLSDDLPGVLTDVSVTTSLGECGLVGGGVDCDLGTVPAGAVVTVTVQAVLAASASGTLTNTATVAAGTDDPEPGNNTSTVSASVGNSADLAISKTGEPQSVTNGDEITYTMVVTNHGPSDAPDSEVSDQLPDGLAYGSCATEQGSCSATGDAVTFDLGSVAAGTAVELQVTATVELDFGGGVLTNTATVTHDGDDPEPDNNEASHRLNVAAAADVSLTKTVSPSPAVAGSAITFTIVATNDGPGPASDLDLTDAVPASVTITGVTPSAGACDSGLSNSLHCELASLAVGADWTVTVTGTLDPATPRGNLRNQATVTVPDDPTDSNNTAVAVAPVVTRASLTITKAAPGEVLAGEALTYDLTVTNGGPSVAAATVAVDRLPEGTTFVSSAGVACEPQADAPNLVVCPVGALPPDDPVTFSITVRVDPSTPDGTTLLNRAQVSSATPSVSTGVPVTATTLVRTSADLGTSKIALPGVFVAGGRGTFVIRVQNDGPSAARQVQVVDTIPAGLTIESVDSSGGTCTTSGATVTCARDLLSAEARWVIVIHVRVDPAASGPVTNGATASSVTPDPASENNADDVTVPVAISADVAMVKTALFSQRLAGETAVFFLSAVGNGPSVATDVVVSDTFPAGLIPMAVLGAGCGISGQQVTCAYPTLGRGEVRTAVVTATVAADAPAGDLTNLATVTATSPDPDPDNNSDDAVVAVAALADLALTKTADSSEIAPGDQVGFTLAVSNAGPSTAQDVLVSDELPDGLIPQDVTADAPLSCTTTGQLVECEAPSLPVGEYTVTIQVEVDPDADDGTLVNTAAVSAATADPDRANNAASADLTIVSDATSPPDLASTGAGSGVRLLASGGLVGVLCGALLLLAVRARRRTG